MNDGLWPSSGLLNRIPAAMEIEGFGERVRDLTGLEVDIVSSRTIENPDLAEAIEREGVVVYER